MLDPSQQAAPSKRWQYIALAVMFGAALALRSVDLGNPRFQFHPTRQYHSAILARAFYARMTDTMSPARKEVAEIAGARAGRFEPPLVEGLVACGYLIVGSEQPAVPRLLSSCFWLIGAWFLFRAARRLISERAAWVALFGFLFLPYGVIASRSFQPDPLMVCLLCASLDAMLVHDELRTRKHLLYASAASALAVLVKPVCVFEIFALFLALFVRRTAPRDWLRAPDLYVFTGLVLAPTVAFYVPSMLGGGALDTQAKSSFQPGLWHQRMFHSGWRQMLERVFGLPALWAAALGIAVSRGRARVALVALGVGYVAYAFAFAYHVMGHDYYQLPAIPVVALAWAAGAERALELAARFDRRWQLAVLGVCAIATVALTAQRIVRYSLPALRPRADERIAMYRKIGKLVGHSSHVIFLSPDGYGGPIQFYGELSGWYWPTVRDSIIAHERGAPKLNPLKRLDELIPDAEYFVSTSPRELHRQDAVRERLDGSFRLRANNDRYQIFDLRQPRSTSHKRP
ncbi:MAG TPA: glycosyltransferase family 39 protein [Polyangiales bacterium]|jgi:hypothetical protein|nr:glycosyltransferase family 39 protein [Polyangiales bacterium]